MAKIMTTGTMQVELTVDDDLLEVMKRILLLKLLKQ